MKILALWGKGSKGKTTTLNLLAKLLKNIGVTKMQKYADGSKNKDNCYVITYKGKKIGITTRGDTKEALEKDFEWLEKCCGGKGCDLYICASRSKMSTVCFIENQIGNGDVFWVSKATISQENKNGYVTPLFVETQQNKLNERQAESLLEFIDEMILNSII